MDASDAYAAYWRSGMKRLIVPWERRHLRFFAYGRVVGGFVAMVCAMLTVSFGGADGKTFAWTAFFLVIAAANIAGGHWQLMIARCAPRHP
jgi:hypothetical protein